MLGRCRALQENLELWLQSADVGEACVFASLKKKKSFAVIASSNPLLACNMVPVMSDFFKFNLNKMLTMFCF